MIKLFALIAGIFLPVAGLFCGTPLSLEACREAARQAGHFEELYRLNEMDLDAQKAVADDPYKFSLSAYGAASYQTDAPNPASLTDFPFVLHSSPKFQYHSGFLLTQTIYSGGSRRLRRDRAELDNAIGRLDLDRRGVELDALVDEVYLSILLARKRDEILSRQLNSLQIKRADAREAFGQGAAYQDAVLALEAQCARLEAELAGNASQTEGALAMLAALTGLPVDASTELELPGVGDPAAGVPDPGLARLDLELRRIELDKQLAHAAARPSLKAFGTIGYGRWPLNFFERKADVYGVAGLTLVVPITGWRSVRQNTSLLDQAARRLALERDNLERRRQVALLQYDAEIARYEALIAANDRTVAKCEALCEELDKLVAQGVSSLSDYLSAQEQLAAALLDGELYAMLRLQQQLLRKQYISKL